MRWGAGLAVVGVVALLVGGGCMRRAPAPGAAVAYTVGPGYQAGGRWVYPREQFQYSASGLAAVADGRARGDGRTADGERVDAGAMTAGHPTLQLPAVARVTNLENGRQALVRVNDRGPADPGRVIALSSRAAAVLGAGPGTRVRVELDEAMSHAVADAARGGTPQLAIAAAPVQSIASEPLAPPSGVAASTRGKVAAVRTVVAAAPDVAVSVPERLADSYTQGLADPGQMYVRGSEFGRADYAQAQRAQLPGLPVQVERVHEPRQDRYRVRAGPFATVASVDAALRQALNAGVADARIVVE